MTQEQAEAFQRAMEALGRSMRAIGQRLTEALRPVASALIEFGKKYGRQIGNLWKAYKAKRRNMKRMNRKTRYALLRSK